jgi:hypothetical protein
VFFIGMAFLCQVGTFDLVSGTVWQRSRFLFLGCYCTLPGSADLPPGSDKGLVVGVLGSSGQGVPDHGGAVGQAQLGLSSGNQIRVHLGADVVTLNAHAGPGVEGFPECQASSLIVVIADCPVECISDDRGTGLAAGESSGQGGIEHVIGSDPRGDDHIGHGLRPFFKIIKNTGITSSRIPSTLPPADPEVNLGVPGYKLPDQGLCGGRLVKSAPYVRIAGIGKPVFPGGQILWAISGGGPNPMPRTPLLNLLDYVSAYLVRS